MPKKPLSDTLSQEDSLALSKMSQGKALDAEKTGLLQESARRQLQGVLHNPDPLSDWPTNGPNSVDAKILAVMASIENVPKKGYNIFSKYPYVTERDAIDAVRVGMVENGLVPNPTMLSHDTGWYDKGGHSTVVMAYRVTDIETGHRRVLVFPGSAKDMHDKAIYKAMTGSMKYFNLKAFLIGGGDDAEADSPDVPHTTTRPNNAPAAAHTPEAKSDLPTHLPPFGFQKNEAIADAETKNLLWYYAACSKNASDPSKAQYKNSNDLWVKAIKAEMDKRNDSGDKPSSRPRTFAAAVKAVDGDGEATGVMLQDFNIGSLDEVPADQQANFLEMLKTMVSNTADSSGPY